jgi:hypothetical protein
MVDQALTYNRAYAAFAPISERLDAVLSGLSLTMPSGLAFIAVGTWIYAVITRRLSPSLLSVALVAFPMEIALSTWGRGYHYYFIAWLPSMGVLAAFATSEVQRVGELRIVRPALILTVFAMSVLPALLVIRLATSTYEVRARRAAEYIVANTLADDTVLIWGSHSEVLFLAERKSPTRYVYQYAALATRGYATADRVDEFLADLVRARPVLIIDASTESFATPPLDLVGYRTWVSREAQYAALPELERVIEYITANYDRAGAEPTTGWPLWRLRVP